MTVVSPTIWPCERSRATMRRRDEPAIDRHGVAVDCLEWRHDPEAGAELCDRLHERFAIMQVAPVNELGPVLVLPRRSLPIYA